MDDKEECKEFRQQFDEVGDGALPIYRTASIANHASICADCSVWKSQMVDILAMTSGLPQFDVSEHLTQSIMATVAAERKLPLATNFGLMLPLGVFCAAGLVAVFPIDTVEGILSTALSLVGVYAVKLMICGDKTEELVA